MKELVRMNVLYSYGCILCVLLTIIAEGHCDEDQETSTMPITTLELAVPSILPESDATSTLPESATVPNGSESVVSSDTAWWLGPVQFDISAGSESANETFNNENGTSTEEWSHPPLIVLRYPLEGPPEMMVGSFSKENGTYKFERENGNSTGENEFDVSDFNMTEFSGFPFEEVDEEIMFDTLNGTVWIEDVFVIPEENITGVENKTGEVETTAATGVENEQMETTVLPTANVSDDTGVGIMTEPEASTSLPSPIGQDTENALPV